MGGRVVGRYFRGGRVPSIRKITNIVKNRGRGGALLQVGQHQVAMMRPEDAVLSIEERFAVVSKSRYAALRIMEVPQAKRHLKLWDLGEVRRMLIDGKTYQVVLGLEATPEVREILERVVRKSSYRVNEKNVVVDVNLPTTQKIIDAINEETGLGVTLFTERIANAVNKKAWMRSVGKKDIDCFWTRTKRRKGNRSAMPEVGMPGLSRDFNPKSRRTKSGIVFGRLKDNT